MKGLKGSDPLGTRFQDAIMSGDAEAVKRIAKEHPELLKVTFGGSSWVSIAVFDSTTSIVDLLIELGCDVNQAGTHGVVALKDAVTIDRPEMMELLLRRGADLSLAEENRIVIGAVAGAKKHALEMVKLLDQYGADLHRVFPNQQTGGKINALRAALDWEKHDVVEYLRSRGAILPEETLPAKGKGAQAAPQARDDDVRAYFAKHFGPVHPLSAIEIVPTSEPGIAINVLRPSKGQNCVTLFTTGMSSTPMQADPGQSKLAELFFQLPSDWKYEDLNTAKWNWPIKLMRMLAQYPSNTGTSYSSPATVVTNGNPPKPLAKGISCTCILLIADKPIEVKGAETIQLFRVIPIYTEEWKYQREHGIGPLMLEFDRHGVSFVFDPNRPNIGKLLE